MEKAVQTAKQAGSEVATEAATSPVDVATKDTVVTTKLAKAEAKKPNIYQRMNKVMAEVSYVQKEDRKVNNMYTFVSHDAVVAKIRPSLIANGIVVVPRVVGHSQDGNRTLVEVEADFVNIDDPSDRITVPGFAFGIDQADKGPGKALSYCLKMIFLKTFCLETGDEADIERQNIDHKPDVITEDQLETIAELALDVGAHIPSFCKFLKINDLSELRQVDYDRAIKALESKRKVSQKASDKSVRTSHDDATHAR
jgi:hypothetical protein